MPKQIPLLFSRTSLAGLIPSRMLCGISNASYRFVKVKISFFSLKKSLFFPSQIKFVGHDVCEHGNRPAQSRRNLLQTWPLFQVCRDIHSFVGFILFYASYIPNAELRMSKLRELMKIPHEDSVVQLSTDKHYAERDDMLQALLANPKTPLVIDITSPKAPFWLAVVFP